MTKKQRFLIGCLVSLVGVGFAVWAFRLGCLKGVQPQLVQLLVSLMAGVAAWAFHGSMTLNAQQTTFPYKAAVVATGGFAVWLVSLYVLVPRFDAACKAESVEETFLRRLASISNLRANYAFARQDRKAAENVVAGGMAAIRSVESVPPAELTPLERVRRATYIGLGYLYLGLCWSMIEPDRQQAREYAAQSVKWSLQAMEQLTTLLAVPEAGGEAAEAGPGLAAYVSEHHYLEFLHQVIGRAELLAYKTGEAGGVERARAAFRKLPVTYVESTGLRTDWIIDWFCKQGSNRKEKEICGNRQSA
jgi:hypothetical protein